MVIYSRIYALIITFVGSAWRILRIFKKLQQVTL